MAWLLYFNPFFFVLFPSLKTAAVKNSFSRLSEKIEEDNTQKIHVLSYKIHCFPSPWVQYLALNPQSQRRFKRTANSSEWVTWLMRNRQSNQADWDSCAWKHKTLGGLIIHCPFQNRKQDPPKQIRQFFITLAQILWNCFLKDIAYT